MSDSTSTDLPRLIRKPRVKDLTGLSDRGIDNRVRKGAFPPPVLLDARQTAWVEREVVEWVQGRVAARDAGELPPARAAIETGRARGGRTRGAAMTAQVKAAPDSAGH